jgi:hypothetical protein
MTEEDMTTQAMSPGDLHRVLETRVAETRAARLAARPARKRGRMPLASVAIVATALATALFAGVAVGLVTDTADCEIEVANRLGYDSCTSQEGTTFEYLGDQNTTFGSAGTGTFNSFVRVQASPNEDGYNTNGTLQFDTKSGTWTHAIKISEIPVVSIGGTLYWELFADINDSNSTPLISLNDVEVWFTNSATLTNYPFTTPPAGVTVEKVYDFNGTVRINDVNQGSGRGDLRVRIPLTGITIPTGCAYGDTGCTQYFLLYNQWGTTGGNYTSDGGFEEWKVKQYPTIRIVKNTVGGNATFDFTVTGPSAPLSPAPSITTAGGTGSTITYIVDPGTYTIDENGPPSGWFFNGAVCSINGGTPTAYTEGSNIVLGETTHVVCTFTNTKAAKIIVDKVTDPSGDPQLFTFDPSWTADFQLADATTPHDSGDLAAGTYSVAETVPAGWDLTSATCSDGSLPSAIGLAAGETVTCTFTNQKDAVIIVDKVTDPSGDPQSFDFDTNYGDNDIDLTDAAAPDNSGDLAPGTYSVAENVPAGWDLTSTVCTSSLGGTESAASIGLTAGETVTCVFTNQKDAVIIVVKQTTPDGDLQSFEFDTNYGANFFLTDGQSNNSGDLAPGTYSVAEVNLPSNWTFDGATCDDGSDPSAIGLSAGETVTCTFNNSKLVNQGCTPGFWQGGFGVTLWNQVDDPDWVAAGGDGFNPFTTTTVFGAYAPFTDTGTSVDSMTMLAIVGSGGGSDPVQKAARDLIAAYLNASFGIDYPYTTATILADWTDATDGGAFDYEDFHAKYAPANELGCPIGAPAPVGLIPFAGLPAGAVLALRRRLAQK